MAEININYGTESEVLVKPTDVIEFVGKDGVDGNAINVSQFALKTDVEGRFIEFSTLVQANAQQILLKANKTVTDELGNRLSLAEASISVTAEQIALKANKNDLDLVSERVTQNEASIIVNADKITSKVDSTTFNSLKDRVSQAESTITQTATQIASKVSQSEFDALGVRTVMNESLIIQTADSISSMVSQSELDAVSGVVTELQTRVEQTEDAISQTVSQSQLDAINGRLTTAESSIVQNANAIVSKVSQTTFNELKSTVDTQTGTINQTGSDLNALRTRVTTAESSITQQANQIQSKVSQTTFDALSSSVSAANGDIDQLQADTSAAINRITQAESTITQQAGQIQAKVSQTTFDATIGGLNSSLGTLAGRVSTAESSITQNANQIQNKVNVSTFNALGDRVTNTESSITQQAGLISSKVSTTDYNGVTIASLINQSPDTVKILAKNIQLQGNVQATSLSSGRTKINVNTNGDFEFFHANGILAFRMTTDTTGKAVFQAFNDAGAKVFDIDTVSTAGIQYVTTTPDTQNQLAFTKVGEFTATPPTAGEEITLKTNIKAQFNYKTDPAGYQGYTHVPQLVGIDKVVGTNVTYFKAGTYAGSSTVNDGYHTGGYQGAQSAPFIANGWYVADADVLGTKLHPTDWDGPGAQTVAVNVFGISGGQRVAAITLQVES